MTLKLFKIACLAYKPSDINYRNKTVDRHTMIQLRRGLIDRISNLLPNCDLFKESAIYPRRYFDDLMIEHGIRQRSPDGSTSVQKIDLNHLSVQRLAGSSPNLHHNLNSNSSNFLPELGGLPFGIGKKVEYENSLGNSRGFIKMRDSQAAHRKQNQSMTIDVLDQGSSVASRQGMPDIALKSRNRVFDAYTLTKG